MIEFALRRTAPVAGQAAFVVRFRVPLKGKYQLSSCGSLGFIALRRFFRIGVWFTGAMAHFTSRNRIRMGRGKCRMPGFAIFHGFRLMAGTATVGSYVFTAGHGRNVRHRDRRRFIRRRPGLGQGWDQQAAECQTHYADLCENAEQNGRNQSLLYQYMHTNPSTLMVLDSPLGGGYSGEPSGLGRSLSPTAANHEACNGPPAKP